MLKILEYIAYLNKSADNQIIFGKPRDGIKNLLLELGYKYMHG